MTHTELIVVGVDGSAAGQRALEWAAAEAARRGRTASVLAVTAWQFDPDDRPESVAIRLPDPAEAARQMLTHAVAIVRAAHPEVAVAGEVVEGDPARALVHASAGADLLVLGGHGHSRLFHAVIGSVTEMCIRLSHCPILVIPMPATAAADSGDVVPAAAA